MFGMRRNVVPPRFAASFILALACGAASAAEPVIPNNPAPAPADILARSRVPAGVFVPLADGAVLHLPSGFVCPAQLPNANLWQLDAYPSPLGVGNDVGCGYGRISNGGSGAEAKFTVFLVKPAEELPLDSVFDHYVLEMHSSYSGWEEHGPVIMADAETLAQLPEFRSVNEEGLVGTRRYANELVVGIVDGWIIELRSTYPLDIVAGDPMGGVDIPIAAIFWATTVNEYADRIEAAAPN